MTVITLLLGDESGLLFEEIGEWLPRLGVEYLCLASLTRSGTWGSFNYDLWEYRRELRLPGLRTGVCGEFS